jgi:hypothetical protein
MPLPLYSQGKSPWYPLDRFVGRQSQSEQYGEIKNFDPAGTPNPSAVQPVASRYTDYATVAPFSFSYWYPLARRLGGPQSQSGRHGEVKILDPTGIQTLTPQLFSL